MAENADSGEGIGEDLIDSLDNEIFEDRPEKIKERASQIQSIINELDTEFVSLIGDEMTSLEKISVFSESVKSKLRKHYSHIFPKKCNNCNRVYHTREEYLRDTERLQKTTTVFDEVGLQEYRNCFCGSTLIVWTSDRRDLSKYGVARRKLFDECLAKLKQISDGPETELRDKLREIFSSLSQ